MTDAEAKLNLITRQLSINGTTIELTQRELQLLATLARAGVGIIVSRDELLHGRRVTFRLIDSVVHSIRKKLPPDNRWLIETHGGRGYSLTRPISLEF